MVNGYTIMGTGFGDVITGHGDGSAATGPGDVAGIDKSKTVHR
jgi:hypothetical protein